MVKRPTGEKKNLNWVKKKVVVTFLLPKESLASKCLASDASTVSAWGTASLLSIPNLNTHTIKNYMAKM